MAPRSPPRQEKKEKPPGRRMSSRNAAERSAFFARREAARVLRAVLQGDARRRAPASIKSLVYAPSIRNKRATFALVCQTLKRLPLIKNVLGTADILKKKWKRQEELIYVAAYDILFGQEIAMTGAMEKFLMFHKNTLKSALKKVWEEEKVKPLEDSLLSNQNPVFPKSRYVRVNTLKMDVESVLQELRKTYMVTKDSIVPDVLVLPPGTDLHDHPLVLNGSVFLQGKASSMVAVALSPKPGWKVLDACAAPGNKTVHLAALMRGKGNIIACELNEERVRLLEDTVRRSGAPNVKIVHKDFLELNPRDSMLSKVHAILLDPSCSGSGISTERLDYLLPSYAKGGDNDDNHSQRVAKLANFQRRALAHALSFPSVERVVYSTCSVHQTENEDVVKSVLPLAASLNFELATALPEWPQRGLPVFEGSEHLLRTNPAKDTEGFFIAMFVRRCSQSSPTEPVMQIDEGKLGSHEEKVPKKHLGPVFYPFIKMSRLWLLHAASKKRTSARRNVGNLKREAK